MKPRHATFPVIWLTGLSGAGKTTIAYELTDELEALGIEVRVLDADIMRKTLCADLGYSIEDRFENVRRIAVEAKRLNAKGYVVIVACIAPFHLARERAKDILGGQVMEVYVNTHVDTCISRDPKGLYYRSLTGSLENMTGIDSTYEIPPNPDLVVGTDCSIKESADVVLKALTPYIAKALEA